MAKNTALGAEKSKKRTPPKPYSEDTLLPAMETAGNRGNSFSLPRMEPT